MDTDPLDPPAGGWPNRVWPAVLIVLGVAALMTVPAYFFSRTMVHFGSFFAGPLLGAVAVVVWWTFGTGVRGRDRWLFPVLLFVPAVALSATLFRPKAPTELPPVVVYALPLATALWVLWLVVSRGMPDAGRRAGLVALFAAGWVTVSLLRVVGTDAHLVPTVLWRWQATDEELYLAEQATRPAGAVAAVAVEVGPADWPGFRGPSRDNVRTGVTIDTDWTARPPQLLWKHRIGPGWGSFAAVGNRLFTQEQRDQSEAVVCLAADTGLPVWAHLRPGRFSETIAGAGPRATPTVSGGRVYALHATGALVCLDAVTGKEVWTADLTATPVNGVVPQWGYSSSPLVVDGLVIVYAGGPEGKGTAAFRADTGALAWAAGNAAHGYSSAHLAALGGVPQVLMTSDYGVEAFRPADGAILWAHPWTIRGMNRVTQPVVLPDGVAFGTGVGNEQGVRRLRVAPDGSGWAVTPAWTSRAMRPYYNDAVLYKDHLFGFDGNRFCCVNVADGKEAWKGGRYGSGQVLLLADQGVLVVQAEDGRVVLVEANPAEHNELGTLKALDGKTWNHPVVAGDRLYVRNGKEAAAYRLTVK